MPTNSSADPDSLSNVNTLTDLSGLAAQADQIVFHFDGNNNDPDDIAAIAVAALLAKAAGIEDQTTFFYGNNLSEPNGGASRLKAMDDSGAFAESLGITAHDYQDDILGTTEKLIAILESGEDILLIEGGPMEAVYRAMEAVDPSLHSNLTLLSHSSWNENRSVKTRDTDGVNDGSIKARTWSDLKNDFPGATYVDIKDQNDGNNNNKGFNNKGWNWMDASDVPEISAARSVMIPAGSTKRNDPSDAGMLFYALTGIDDGTPSEAQNYIFNSTNFGAPDPDPGPDPDPTPDPDPDPTPSPVDGDLFEVGLFFADDQSVFVDDLETDDTLNASDLGDRPVSLVATALDGVPSIGSVELIVPGFGARIENVTPYALFGDKNGTLLGGKALDPGTYPLTLVAYSGKNKGGDIIGTQELDFTVAEAPPANTPPVAKNDTATTAEDTAVTIDVLKNDQDADGDALTVKILSGPANGSAQVVGNKVRYTPDADHTGSDSLTYSITDPSGDTDEATVFIDVTPVDDPTPPDDDDLFQVGLFFTDDQSALIEDLSQDSVVALSELDDRPISFVATPVDGAPKVGSVMLSLPGVNTRVENVDPFALFGDTNGKLFKGEALDPGEYTLTLTAYSGSNKKGDVLGTQEVTITVSENANAVGITSVTDLDLLI